MRAMSLRFAPQRQHRNDNKLKGFVLDLQTLVFDLTSNTFGMTNGSEWFLGR